MPLGSVPGDRDAPDMVTIFLKLNSMPFRYSVTYSFILENLG